MKILFYSTEEVYHVSWRKWTMEELDLQALSFLLHFTVWFFCVCRWVHFENDWMDSWLSWGFVQKYISVNCFACKKKGFLHVWKIWVCHLYQIYISLFKTFKQRENDSIWTGGKYYQSQETGLLICFLIVFEWHIY